MVLYFPRRIVYAKRKNTELQINLYTSYRSTAFQMHCKIKYKELRTIIYLINISLVLDKTTKYLENLNIPIDGDTISLCIEGKNRNIIVS